MENKLSVYYVAHVKRELCWLLSAVFRGTEHIAFDRVLDKEQSLFEFFVPQDTEPIFLDMIAFLKKKDVVLSLEKRNNRLASRLP